MCTHGHMHMSFGSWVPPGYFFIESLPVIQYRICGFLPVPKRYAIRKASGKVLGHG